MALALASGVTAGVSVRASSSLVRAKSTSFRAASARAPAVASRVRVALPGMSATRAGAPLATAASGSDARERGRASPATPAADAARATAAASEEAAVATTGKTRRVVPALAFAAALAAIGPAGPAAASAAIATINQADTAWILISIGASAANVRPRRRSPGVQIQVLEVAQLRRVQLRITNRSLHSLFGRFLVSTPFVLPRAPRPAAR